MNSMTQPSRAIVAGVDAHTDTHDAAVLDDCGRLLGTRTFPAVAAGYRELTAWVGRFGALGAIAVESTGSYAAGLVRHLRTEGLEVLEVNQPHAHTRRRRGKSDPIDAEMAARHVLAASSIVIAKDTTGVVESIRQLRVARDGAVKARSAALNALGGLIVSAPSSCASSFWRARPRARPGDALRAVSPRPDAAARTRPRRQSGAAVARAPSDRSQRRDLTARPPAQATPRRRGTGEDRASRGLHRPRRHAAGHRRPEHRTPPQPSVIRRPCGRSLRVTPVARVSWVIALYAGVKSLLGT